MTSTLFASRAATLNARVGAVALAIGAFMTLALSHTAAALAPLRILTLAVAAFALWAFSDEMGIRKPLNRAGLVFFSIAAFTKVQVALGVDASVLGRYLLSYAGFLLLALLCWSLAFLHRQRELKLAGALGLLATAAPIAAIVVGHVAVGMGAVFGVGGLLAAAQGDVTGDIGFVTVVERIFGLWGYLAAWFLWRGHIAANG
jgi:hypothetical protein